MKRKRIWENTGAGLTVSMLAGIFALYIICIACTRG